LHAVCSSRTQSQRDPWVNMLRVTTEVFAAALGGAALVTPRSFDEALGPASAHGRRVARNTALVLREESHLGRVMDPAGGSYYLETRTDALAREAWARFGAIEREGGILKLLRSGVLRERLAAAWDQRAAAIARRKELVLGVSEFANVGETLPGKVPGAEDVPAAPALVPHRDAEGFERLRAQVERRAPEVVLVAMGPASEHRGRVGYAEAFFATVGVRTRVIYPPIDPAAPGSGQTVVLCGSDERYANEAVALANILAGHRVVLAGRPGALEPALRQAGVSTFIFVGCDVLATLTDLLGAP
jgi:methylmalonyl-CoA mutase